MSTRRAPRRHRLRQHRRAIAANLSADGHHVSVYDTDADALPPLVGLGARSARTRPPQVAERSEITFLSLPTPAVVEEVAGRVARRRAAGCRPRRPQHQRAGDGARARRADRGGRPPPARVRRSPAAPRARRLACWSSWWAATPRSFDRVEPLLARLGRADLPRRRARARQHRQAGEQSRSRSRPHGHRSRCWR